MIHSSEGGRQRENIYPVSCDLDKSFTTFALVYNGLATHGTESRNLLYSGEIERFQKAA